MKKALLLAGLAACATTGTPGTVTRSPDDVYRAQAEATLTSLECSRRTAMGFGYQVWYDGSPEGTLRAILKQAGIDPDISSKREALVERVVRSCFFDESTVTFRQPGFTQPSR